MNVDYPLTISKKRLTFRTWELLSIKMISKVVDEISVKAFLDSKQNQQNQEQNQNPFIETDTIKRLVKAFLPQFPEKCRLENNLKAIFSYYDWDHTQERNVRLPLFPGLVGDSMWVAYGDIRNDEDDLDDDPWSPFEAGIACVEILSKQANEDDDGSIIPGGMIVANIREKLSFDHFCDYFKTNSSYRNEMDVSYYNENQPGKFPLSAADIDLWRRDNQVVGIDMNAQAYYFATERMYKQVDGTWCHGFSMFESISNIPQDWESATVGRSFLSEARVQDVLTAWIDQADEVEDV